MFFVDPAFSSDLELNPFLQNPHPSDHFTLESVTTHDLHENSREDNVDHYYANENSIYDADDWPDFSITNEPTQQRVEPELIDPHIPSQAEADMCLGDRFINMAMSPTSQLSAALDINRLARVQVIAGCIQRENKAQKERAQASQNASIDPYEDDLFDPSIDLGEIASSENDISSSTSSINNPSLGDGRDSSFQDSLEDSTASYEDVRESDPSFGAKIVNSIKEMISIEKICSEAKKQMNTWHPTIDNSLYSGPIIDAYNNQPNQKALLLENVLRGTNDVACRAADLGLRCISSITPLEYSSAEFLEKHLYGPTDNNLEANLGYWIGRGLAEYVSLKGVGTVASKGAQLSSKVIEAAQKSGVKAATMMKLTTGAIGEGISPFVNQRISSLAPSAGRIVSENIQLKTPYVYVIEAAKKCPSLAQRAPEVANIFKNTQAASALLGRQFVNLNTLYEQVRQTTEENANPVIRVEVDAVANNAISEMIQESSLAQGVFEDFEKLIDSLDSPSSLDSFENYERFVFRQQAREFLNSLDFAPDCIQNTLNSTNFSDPFSAEFIEGLLKKAQNIERTLRYCQRYNVSDWVENKLLEINLPFQKHHVFSDKCIRAEWTRGFKKILDKYELGFNEKWNLIMIPHSGPHHNDYHEWVMGLLNDIDGFIEANETLTHEKKREAFLNLYEEKIKIPLLSNPLLPMHKWYKFWRNDKLQADILKSSSTKDEVTSTP